MSYESGVWSRSRKNLNVRGGIGRRSRKSWTLSTEWGVEVEKSYTSETEAKKITISSGSEYGVEKKLAMTTSVSESGGNQSQKNFKHRGRSRESESKKWYESVSLQETWVILPCKAKVRHGKTKNMSEFFF